MKIIFISNYFTHHQKPFADELDKETNHHFVFLATSQMSEDRKKLGWSIENPQYVNNFNSNRKEDWDTWRKAISEADIVIKGSGPVSLLNKREINKKVTFVYSERLFKSKLRYLKAPIYMFRAFKLRGCYMLCASAYTAGDYNMLGFYKEKCYKWGYFPEVRIYDDIEELFQAKREKSGLKQLDVSILWVARFIGWKHPEAAIEVAKMLKRDGVRFVLNMIGAGPLESDIKQMINDNGLSDDVCLLGAIPQQEVRAYMEKSDVFIFTSDQNEGWGAVLNEAMNSGCAVVASDAIGSVPYLVKNKKNGLVFKDKNWDDLFNKIRELALSASVRKELGIAAYRCITEQWNAKEAVKRLLELSESIQNNTKNYAQDGPCSKA